MAVNTCFTASAQELKHDGMVVSDLHPRLYVRADDATIGRGLTLSALRARLHDPAYRHWVDYEGGLHAHSISGSVRCDLNLIDVFR